MADPKLTLCSMITLFVLASGILAVGAGVGRLPPVSQPSGGPISQAFQRVGN